MSVPDPLADVTAAERRTLARWVLRAGAPPDVAYVTHAVGRVPSRGAMRNYPQDVRDRVLAAMQAWGETPPERQTEFVRFLEQPDEPADSSE